jgi:large subunit ribosomal protein LX
MKTFEAKGTYTKKGKENKYTKKIEAENEKMAKEKIYATFGGKQKIRRGNIKISELTAAKQNA